MTWRSIDYKEFFTERAAIYEFDGGLSRKEAEARAQEDKRKLIEEHLRQKSEESKRGIV